MKYLVVVALSIALAGCLGFRRDRATSEQFYAELAQCEHAATPESTWCANGGCRTQQHQIERARNHCMQARGWQLTRSGDKFVP